MEDNIFDKVHEVDLKKTMETSYIDYAMSVIAVSYTHLDVYKRQSPVINLQKISRLWRHVCVPGLNGD